MLRFVRMLDALVAALLFGASAPLVKRLVADIGPVTLAGLLYAGSALALAPVLAWRTLRRADAGAALRRSDVPALVASALVGSVLAPIALTFGLTRVSASAGALLLNLETPLTLAFAAVVFRERVGARFAGAFAAMLAGGAVLAFAPGPLSGSPLGTALVAAAALSWAVDSALQRTLSARAPVAVVVARSGLGAPVALVLGRALGEPWPGAGPLVAALAVGGLAYGASIVFYLRSLRRLGLARTSTGFALAPFVGALAAWPIAGERPGLALGVAAALMAAGSALLLGESHRHPHVHEAGKHAHLHVHDEHHAHAHSGDEGPEPHIHPHRHERLEHDHPHEDDARHGHSH